MKILETLHGLIWGMPALVLIIGVGVFLTLRTGFAQIALLPRAMGSLGKQLFSDKGKHGCSSFQSLCTALAATVGTGNLVGVAGAICLGGPGAIFWMWICGLLGMIIKYAEATLAVRYRVKNKSEYLGGPMYMIPAGLGKRWNWLAKIYCCFGLIASFGVGNLTQMNAVTAAFNDVLETLGCPGSMIRNLVVGILLALLVGKILSGGAKRIRSVAEIFVPILSACYILLCVGVLLARWDRLPDAFSRIFRGAFSPKGVTGGMLGSAFRSLKVGCSRGIFTNEAGMGTASIAHASAQVQYPAEQGLMGILEVFLDTMVICTLTALVILVSGVPVPYGTDVGGALTNAAFSSVYGSSALIFLAVALCCFAFAALLGWGLYGGRCAQFLFGENCWKRFVVAQTAAVCFGSVLNTEAVWLFAEAANGLMLIPNIVALAVLSPEVVRLTKEMTGSRKAGGGTYANFNQCKSL